MVLRIAAGHVAEPRRAHSLSSSQTCYPCLWKPVAGHLCLRDWARPAGACRALRQLQLNSIEICLSLKLGEISPIPAPSGVTGHTLEMQKQLKIVLASTSNNVDGPVLCFLHIQDTSSQQWCHTSGTSYLKDLFPSAACSAKRSSLPIDRGVLPRRRRNCDFCCQEVEGCHLY
jgi:hypothetical protein